MTENTATLLAEMQPAWLAAIGGRVSSEYVAGYIRRNRERLEAALSPIASALSAVPPVSVYEIAEDVARRLRGLSAIANALTNTPENLSVELDRQLPRVMVEYLPTVAGGQTMGADAPKNLATYRRWSDDEAFRRKLRDLVREILWDRRPGWLTGSVSSDDAEIEETKAEKDKEARVRLRSTQLRNAATKIAERRVKVAADSIALLRRQDVERVLNETPSAERRQVAYILGERRPELVDEIDEVMREVLGEPANWSTYGRDEIYQPGARERREAAKAEDDAPSGPEVMIRPDGEVGYSVDGRWENVGFVAQESGMYWPRNGMGDPIVDPFGDPIISEGRPSNKAVPARDSTPTESAELKRALDAAEPLIDEAERKLAALAAEDGKPRPVVMASLEAGGILLLSPLGFLGRDLFQTYRDATSRLQYVSYPKKGQRGIPKVVARAVLALERDGFEVRAETPEVVKSLIVTGGLDHALPVGLPPPRSPQEAPARPPTRTSNPSLIARVNALAADPPTSTLKYLVKTLRERGDLPLQVKDWKEGGWRPVETAIEEAEGKAARRLARKPKAERLRAGGVERPAKDANEEHAAQALVQLANMDPDKAHEVNEAGFSKSDVATGHTLARRWEATGELTGDEWDWAVAVANKYRRQVGPLPESPTKSKRTRATKAPTMAWPPRQAIVIAWLVDDIEIVSIGRTDLGERPVTRDIKVPKAAMWMNSGTVEDVEEAEEYAAKDGHSVFVFPDDHPDPLGAAKQLIVEGPRDPLKVLVDRLHGEPPKAPNNLKHQRSKASGMSVEDRLFVGVMPTGIVYADRSREVDGDYARCAFLPFDTLALEIAPKCPKDMLDAIKADAATIIARRGEQFKISASDQTVVLGRAAQNLSRYTGDYGPNVEQILVHATRVVRGRIPSQVRAELRAAVAAGVLGRLKKDGLKPEVFFHPDHKHGAIDLQKREAEHAIGNIASVMATPQDVRSGMEALGEDVEATILSRSAGRANPQPYLLFRGPDGHEAHSVSDLVPLLEAEFGPDAMTTASAMPGSDPVADLGRWYARERGLEYLGPEQFGFRMHPWPSLEAERSHLERVAPQAAMALANLPGPERQAMPPDPYWAEREAEHQQEKYRAAQRQADADAGSRSLRRSERSARLAEAEASLSHYASELKLDPTNEHTRKQVKFYRSLIRGLSKPIRERP